MMVPLRVLVQAEDHELGLSSLWMTAGSLLFALVGALRLPRAGLLDSPIQKLRLTLPEALAAGTALVPPGTKVSA